MKKHLLLFAAALYMSTAAAQITSALSPQVGPAIVNGKVFLIGGGDYSIGGDQFRVGLGAMFSLTDPKVKIMGSGPFRHNISYYGISAEYAFYLSDVISTVLDDHEVRVVVMGGIGASGLEYIGTSPLPVTSTVYPSTSYYILQPGLFYTIADVGVPMQVGLSFRYIQSPNPPQMKPRYFTGVNLTYRVTIDYDSIY